MVKGNAEVSAVSKSVYLIELTESIGSGDADPRLRGLKLCRGRAEAGCHPPDVCAKSLVPERGLSEVSGGAEYLIGKPSFTCPCVHFHPVV